MVEVTTREEPSTLFLLSSGLLSSQPCSAARLKHGSSQSCEPSDDGTQEAANRTRHAWKDSWQTLPVSGALGTIGVVVAGVQVLIAAEALIFD